MSFGITAHTYDGGLYAGACLAQNDIAPVKPGMIAYVTQCLPNGLYEINVQPIVSRPHLGIITDITYSTEDKCLIQVQTDGTLTLQNLKCDDPKTELAPGNLISWEMDGTLLPRQTKKNCVGCVLHRNSTGVRIQIIHEHAS